MQTALRTLFERAVAQKKVPGIGAFLVDQNGNFLFKDTFGTNNIDDSSAPNFDSGTMLQMFSCTKLVTSIAALQLMEQGSLSLSDPVEKYVPQISKIQVLEAFEPGAKKAPILRPPESGPTVLQLLTHTAGFTYDFLDPLTLQYRQFTNREPSQYYIGGKMEDFQTPFTADPGTKYIYGISTDWLGLVVEAASQMALDKYIEKNILNPLGMSNTKARVPPGKARLFMHLNIDGQLVAHTDTRVPETVPVLGGGGYLYSTMDDYAKLLATILNQGRSAETGAEILKPETVGSYLFTDLLPPDIDRSLLGRIGSSVPILSSQGSFLPSLSDRSRGWSSGLMLNHEDLPYGRKKGSGGWSGLGNLYYWIDPTTKLAGMVCTAILPFFNPTVLKLFDQLERVAYGHELSLSEDEHNGNYCIGLPE